MTFPPEEMILRAIGEDSRSDERIRYTQTSPVVVEVSTLDAEDSENALSRVALEVRDECGGVLNQSQIQEINRSLFVENERPMLRVEFLIPLPVTGFCEALDAAAEHARADGLLGEHWFKKGMSSATLLEALGGSIGVNTPGRFRLVAVAEAGAIRSNSVLIEIVEGEWTRLVAEAPASHSPAPSRGAFPIPLIGGSRWASELRDGVFRVAATDDPVIIQGEPGVGKECVAREIHLLGHRRHLPFVSIPCADVSQDLLVGQPSGRSTEGLEALTKKVDEMMSRANAGTLFLDSIEALPLQIQQRIFQSLPRAMEPDPAADLRTSVDLRIIMTTSDDPIKLVAARCLHLSLYSAGSIIRVPPLRDRSNDFPEIASVVLRDVIVSLNGTARQLSDEVMAAFLHYSWPGNLRELRNVLERASIASLSADTISLQDLPAGFGLSSMSASSHEELERSEIIKALHSCDSRISEAARSLGLTEAVLRNRMRKYGVRHVEPGEVFSAERKKE